MSGGQKQRILIARALLRDAPILIMDEFTSAIDASTENTIWSNIQPRLQGKTVLIVTHRMTILNSVDRILFFENGKIIEDGSLDDLLKLGGKFAETWEAGQGRGFIASDEEIDIEILAEKHVHHVIELLGIKANMRPNDAEQVHEFLIAAVLKEEQKIMWIGMLQKLLKFGIQISKKCGHELVEVR